MSILDAYQAIDEIVIQWVAGGTTAETAMEHIANIISEQED